MKIALAHNFYREPGGEDSVYRREQALFRSKGHEIFTYEADSREISSSPLAAARIAGALAYSKGSRRKFARFLLEHRPDVVHVHNWFPLLTPSIYDACIKFGIPIVQTLHNYRITCSNGLFLRDGKPCEDCVRASPYLGAIRGCYRDSRLASLPVARMIAHHRARDTWNRKVTRFIALSEFSRNKLIGAGIGPSRISVSPPFIEDTFEGREQARTAGGYAIYVGRLSAEKGLRTLFEAWKDVQFPLKIVGSGPLENEVRSGAFALGGQVSLLGWKTASELSDFLNGAAFLVLPSECYETFGMVVIEAFAHGVPVLVSDAGSPAELVLEGENGLLFRSGEPQSLKEGVHKLLADRGKLSEMGANARKTYLERYTPEAGYQALWAIYQEVTRRPSS